MNFDNSKVWITGASSGIGEALAYSFSEKGAVLILSARNEKELQRVKANCTYPEKVFIFPLDVANHQQVFEVGKKVLEKVGSVDILVNNAGISQRALAVDTSFEVDKQMMDVNFLGTVAVTKTVLSAMIQQQKGHIVVISSVVGKIGSPVRTAYSASKHALQGFFDSLRAELDKHHVKVTIVCPGYIKTNISMNALKGDGSKQGTMDETTNAGLSPRFLAEKILQAIAKGKEEIWVGGTREITAIYLKRFFPSIFSKIIKKAKVT